MAMSVGKKGFKSDINITPYIDILLVLLIIFMVAAPLKQHEHPVRVPQPAPIDQKQNVNSDMIIVDMDFDHTLRLNDQPMTAEKLEATLTEIFNRRANKNMFVRGDSSLPYGDVFALLDMAKRSGAVDIALLDKNQRQTLRGQSQGTP